MPCRIDFDNFFKSAMHQEAFGFQRRFAEALHPLVQVPTGLGKTAMVVLGWLWRRRFGSDEVRSATPRRLAYCLPMRVLVEQTARNAKKWVSTLRSAGYLDNDVPIHILMGGEEADDWEIHPEREAIIVGTQDMLLSRALNRGYAASRSRWPMQFGLLHTDCLWVFDEIQLMGAGLATTAQLQAFRRLLGSKDGHGCRSVWMSATMRRDWLKTVDFAPSVDDLPLLELDVGDRSHPEVKKRWTADKPVNKADSSIGDNTGLAREILKAHKPGTRTIVVVNVVRRACELWDAISKSNSAPQAVLLHSRFRPKDRDEHIRMALAGPPAEGVIVVSTQVIEAGVDLSAMTLFTEVAPWASLVQRFGRCNRRGEDSGARVFWVDLPNKDADAGKLATPYDLEVLTEARRHLNGLKDAGLKSLPGVELSFEHHHVIRRKDMIDLFDTTPDLAGNDIDIDRFVREIEGSDVRVFWRNWDQKANNAPPQDEPAPRPEELCPAPVGEFRDFAKKHDGKVWRWNFLDETWEKADVAKIAPGQVFLVHADAGGYSAERGWNSTSTTRVEPIRFSTGTKGESPDGNGADWLCYANVWQTIAQHTDEVCTEIERILTELEPAEAEALRLTARWHDRGKAHDVFRTALLDGVPDAMKLWAKAAGERRRYGRRHFRHELASALAVLIAPGDTIPAALCDLVAYLVAAHHGKVRLSIRSLPNERRPDANGRFARGVWDGDTLPETDLGGGVIAPTVTLSLEPMELGLCEQPPFAGQPSWAERMIRLRDTLGPFRLAYLEAILRAADWRASRSTAPSAGAREATRG